MYNDFCLKKYADMAQAVEHVLGKDEVTGSNPVISSKKSRLCACFFLFALRLTPLFRYFKV